MRSVGGKKRILKRNGDWHLTNPNVGMRLYATPETREEAFKSLRANGRNYFTFFKDTNGYGLSYGTVDWISPGGVYIKR